MATTPDRHHPSPADIPPRPKRRLQAAPNPLYHPSPEPQETRYIVQLTVLATTPVDRHTQGRHDAFLKARDAVLRALREAGIEATIHLPTGFAGPMSVIHPEDKAAGHQWHF